MTTLYAKGNLFKGEFFEAEVPDTLDLAERVKHAINAMTGALATQHDYEYVWRYSFNVPRPGFHGSTWWDSNPRAAFSLPLMRSITGSKYKLDIEEKMAESMLSRVGSDGLLYNPPFRNDCPWRGGGAGCRAGWKTKKDVAVILGSFHLLCLYASWYEREGDSKYLEMGRRTLKTLREIAIYKDDYAYYPGTNASGLEFAYFKDSGWPDSAEAIDEADSVEGTTNSYFGVFVWCLSRWYSMTKDEGAMELAAKLVNYMLKPQFWMGNVENWMTRFPEEVFRSHGGLQRKPAALFKAHTAGITYTMQGLIEYAIAADDVYLKQFVREAYEHMRLFGLSRIGMWGENIANNNMAAIAIKLSDAGVGDFWDDVDQIVRNAMVEDQYIDAEILKAECKRRGDPFERDGWNIDRFLGSLRWCGLINLQGVIDPTQNGLIIAGPYLEPFYFVWESIVRYKEANANVNLLLNRVSPWLDVESHLPYEGKVLIRNKTAKNISIRIPAWVEKAKLRCDVAGRSSTPFWVQNYLVVSDLSGAEKITVTFPMVETTQTYYLVPWTSMQPWHTRTEKLPKYVLSFKGNTCIKSEFPNREVFFTGYTSGKREEGYPVYQRERYRQNKAPLKKVQRYIAPKCLSW